MSWCRDPRHRCHCHCRRHQPHVTTILCQRSTRRVATARGTAREVRAHETTHPGQSILLITSDAKLAILCVVLSLLVGYEKNRAQHGPTDVQLGTKKQGNIQQYAHTCY